MTNEQRFALIQKYIERMPSLSTTVTKVLEVCNRPSTSANDLNRVIALDPVLTGQVLKLINSAYYSLPNQISSLTRAIIMLGINTVKNLALSTAVLGSMGRQDSFRSLSMDAFWTHSLCVGVLAKALAGLKGIPGMMQEEFFVAGLLHDLGKIPLNNCFAEEYRQALELSTIEQGSLPKAEEIMLGFDHGHAGKMIADKWQLSQALTELLRFHHAPENASPNNRQLVSVVALANTYANLFDVGSAGDRFPDTSRVDELLLLVGLKWHDLSSLHTVVEQEIEKAQVFLQIAREAA
ncbi:MAG: HDOD domain-containing protein [Proteobacteria bacterium]|nr:HDOD domain-containing protein [Pseudomonadota bacterium]MBU4230029.1 HDOD domain-containing protein [Pseudomonadota bacterium]MBU4407131.1 HDOD domain-containing protein [Pseudomonadota bacterium]MBU4412313.1 HDOD domain-containing protein [Pseudomonadota bacterium]